MATVKHALSGNTRAADAVERAAAGAGEGLTFSRHYLFFQAEDVIRDRTVTGVQTCALPICLEDQLTLIARDDLLALRRRDERQPVAMLDHAFDFGLPHRLLGDACRRAADVEGPQGQLRARLADRLRGQNPDRFAEVHHVHRGEVAAVAHPAYATLRLARQDRADLHRLDARILDGLRGLLSDQLARFDQHFRPAVFVELVWIHHLFERYAADDALAQRLDDVFAFLQGRHLEAEDRPAVLFCNRDI